MRETELKIHSSAIHHIKSGNVRRLTAFLCCAVLVITGYFSVLPGYTETLDTFCGEEEHIHGVGCYAEPELVCPWEENHVHTGDCYTATEEYTCGMDGVEGHEHSDECIQRSLTLICEIPEGHVHSEDCYAEPELVCELNEHTHTSECYSDCNADVETAEEWEATFADCDLTGDWTKDVLVIAASQIGYKESAVNYQVADDGELKGYSRYGAWYGSPYGDWCAMFCAFCLRYAGLPEDLMTVNSNCDNWMKDLIASEQFVSATEDYMPKAGDLVFFGDTETGVSDHMGFYKETVEATETESAGMITVEGNVCDVVSECTHTLPCDEILGYGVLPEYRVAAEETSSESEDTDGTGISGENVKEMLYEGEGFSVSLSYDEEAGIPEGTVLAVTEIPKELDIYSDYMQQSLALLSENGDIADNSADAVGLVRFFDITLLYEGVEIEPSSPVGVKIVLSDLTDEENGSDFLPVVHFGENGTERIQNATVEGTEDGTCIAYSQNSFSVTGLFTAPAPLTSGMPPLTLTDSTPVVFGHNKTIDYLGDKGANTQTTVTGTDLYRLYLDITGDSKNGLDLLIVIDASTSMSDSGGGGFSGNGGAAAVRAFLNSGTGNIGFMKSFLSSGKNNLAIISFNGNDTSGKYTDSSHTILVRDWGKNDSNLSSSDIRPNGYTNYVAALYRANDLFHSTSYSNLKSTNDKVMFFLSDGVPTVSFSDGNSNGLHKSNSMTVPDDTTKTNTDNAIVAFRNNNTDVKIVTARFGDDSGSDYYLDYLDDGDRTNSTVIPTNSSDTLNNAIKTLVYPKTVVIEDKLSENVDYYTTQPDLILEMVNSKTNNATTIWKNGAPITGTDGTTTLKGADIVDSVVYDDATKTVKATFDVGYYLDNAYIYRVSFNVKASTKAYENYRDNSGYGTIKGDAGTDWTATNNITSTGAEGTGAPGFYSNDSASVSYYYRGTAQTETYDKPVVQVHYDTPTTSDSYAIVEKHFKGIEAKNIPADFTLTLAKVGDTSTSFTLNKTCTYFVSETVGTDKIVWKWSVPNLPEGQYTATETSYKVSGFDTAMTVNAAAGTAGTGNIVGTVTITSSGTVSDVVTTEGTPVAKEYVLSETGVWIGHLPDEGSTIVLSETDLPLTARMKIAETLTTNGYSWTTPVFCKIADKDKIAVLDRVFEYDGTSNTVKIYDPDAFTRITTLSYTGAVSEIIAVNTYSVNSVKIKIQNTVVGTTTTHKFPFSGSYTVDGVTKELKDIKSFDPLGHNDSIVYEVPYGATVTFTETEHNGYVTTVTKDTIQVSDHDSYTTPALTADVTYVVVNNPGVRLPDTGGRGDNLSVLFGSVLSVGSCIGICVRRKRRMLDF